MDLSILNVPENKIKQLNKAGIQSLEDLLTFYPKKYCDRTRLTGILPSEQESVFLYRMESVRYITGSRTPMIKATGVEVSSGWPVNVIWFNQSYRYTELCAMVKKTVLVAGRLELRMAQYKEPAHYETINPPVFSPGGTTALGMYPIYRKIPGMAEDYLQMCIRRAADVLGKQKETVPQSILSGNHLISHQEMITQLHWPNSVPEMERAMERKRWDDLLYFALRIELNYRGAAIGSPFNIPLLKTTRAIINALPYKLTQDQETTINDMFAKIRTGKRLNALVQGDVGCGKTIVAFLLMAAFAENGYQAALMAPTQLLAKQHYDELCRLMAPYGIKVAFVSGQKLRKAEQQQLEQGIANGEFSLIVGTQALLSDTYQFRKLAMVIEDEEHKYGVMQRQALTDKAAAGTHIVTLSATPIPRTLAQTIFGDNVQLYSIKTKPTGRLTIRTGYVADKRRILGIVYNEVARKGHQAYIICPMVAPNEKVEGVATAEETYEFYKEAYDPYGIPVAFVTGKTKKTDAAQILQDFNDNKISVLVSTTVIEVGINVPNASCIVIHNAERFGLAQLHQLRGRVGRGKDQAYCVLESAIADNPRLRAMCEYSDGFRIAEMDLELRGAGDLLGSQQSGTEKYLAMALCYSEEYKRAQIAAREILDTGVDCELFDKAVRDQKENVGGEMVG